MSRRKYTVRQNNEYARYKKVFRAYKKKLAKKGIDFYDPIMYKKAEYFSKKSQAIQDFKEEHGISSKTKITIPNYLRDTVYSQAYYRDLKEVRQSKLNISENIIRTKREILTGELEIVDAKGKKKIVTFEEYVSEGKKLKPDELSKKVQDLIAQKEKDLKLLKEASKFRISEIRAGKQEFLDVLSQANDELKKRGMDNSFDRRAWIRKEFFGYAS